MSDPYLPILQSLALPCHVCNGVDAHASTCLLGRPMDYFFFGCQQQVCPFCNQQVRDDKEYNHNNHLETCPARRIDPICIHLIKEEIKQQLSTAFDEHRRAETDRMARKFTKRILFLQQQLADMDRPNSDTYKERLALKRTRLYSEVWQERSNIGS